MFNYVKRVSGQRPIPWNVVTALKREQSQSTSSSAESGISRECTADVQDRKAPLTTGPILRPDGIWRSNALQTKSPYNTTLSSLNLQPFATHDATQSSLPSQQCAVETHVLQNVMEENSTNITTTTTSCPSLANDLFPLREQRAEFEVPTQLAEILSLQGFDPPVANMEAFLQELGEDPSGSEIPGQLEQIYTSQQISTSSIGGSASSSAEFRTSYLNPTPPNSQFVAEWSPSLEDGGRSAQSSHRDSAEWPMMDSSKTFDGSNFDAVLQATNLHLWSVGPVPDISIFHLFRKAQNKEQVDSAVEILFRDRQSRTSRGITTPYSEATSAAVFNAFKRNGEADLVIAAAEQATDLGLTLSLNNMYQLMKQYSSQGKVEHVKRLFRALENSGTNWNSKCIGILMLAYFNQGRFEEADRLRQELKSRGIKISERIENRLDLLLSGEERWKWEDQVYYRPKRSTPLSPPPGFASYGRDSISPIQNYQALSQGLVTMTGRGSGILLESPQDLADRFFFREVPTPTLLDAVKEPRVHLNILRAAGFDDLHSVLSEFVKTEGPVENVCISFMFRKVETKHDAERAMQFLKEERAARTQAGISEEYNETTCSRIFTALFRTGASDLAFTYAHNAAETGLVLSGKALHELLKSFAMRNEVEKVEQIWALVKLNGKPSSRIVYSIFRTYFDNGMMDRACRFQDEIHSIGIRLSASATRNIDEVLSGAKRWVKDPHSGDF